MGNSPNEQTARRIFALLEKQDWDAVLDHYHEDIVIEWPQSGERVHGKDACLAIFINYPEGSPRASIRTVRGGGDTVVVEAESTYPDRSTWYVVAVLDFEDGRVVHETDYFAAPFEPPDWRSQWVELA
jgi:ketosteroid isomerase-like protein